MDDIFDFSIINFLHEDDGTDIINGGPANTDNDANQDAAADTGAEDQAAFNNDDDFNIDTSLDSGDDTGEEGGDDLGGDDEGGMEGDGDVDGSSPSEEEVNPANTDVFATLTAEEQKIKIMQLKSQYNDLYTYCDDLLTKMNDMDLEEDTLEVVSKISSDLYSLKDYIRDYMISIFPMRSFIENDIFYNRFVAQLSSIQYIIDQLAVGREKKLGIEDNDK